VRLHDSHLAHRFHCWREWFFLVDRNTDGRLSYTYALEESVRAINWQRLQQLKDEVLNKFPFAYQTADQAFRITDIAFDINQDRTIDREDAFTIAQYCWDAGMVARISSIHINSLARGLQQGVDR